MGVSTLHRARPFRHDDVLFVTFLRLTEEPRHTPCSGWAVPIFPRRIVGSADLELDRWMCGGR
jgi:hypothetical protein